MNTLIFHLKAGHAGIMTNLGRQGPPHLQRLLGHLNGGHLVVVAHSAPWTPGTAALQLDACCCLVATRTIGPQTTEGLPQTHDARN